MDMSPPEITSRSTNNEVAIGNEPEHSLGYEEFESDDRDTEVTNEVAGSSDGLDAFRKPKRTKKSKAWLDFSTVKVGPENTVMSQCNHCKAQFKKTKIGTTTSLLRHMKSCSARSKNLQVPQQRKINFPSTDSNTPHSYLHTEKFDMASVRESAVEWVLMHEHPFSIVEEEGFNLMQKRGMFEWQKINRTGNKNGCRIVYEREKTKLKAMLAKVKKISLTTDLWKSKNKKIEYMVITGHWIDSCWKLQKRVLNFVHIPPPRRGVQIADSIFKCVKDWGIDSKVYTIYVDNASNNDTALRAALRALKDTFSRNKCLLAKGKLFQLSRD